MIVTKATRKFTKAMPIIAESQFLWSKISMSMAFDTGVWDGRRLVLKFANIPVTLETCDFAFFYQSSS